MNDNELKEQIRKATGLPTWSLRTARLVALYKRLVYAETIGRTNAAGHIAREGK